MRANHLAVIFSAKELPQNTVHACGAIWAETSRMLLPGLGKFYARFYPAARPWDITIRTPFSVVLGQDDPCRFLRLYLRAREFRESSIRFHTSSALAETDVEKLQAVGNVLICPVAMDGTNKSLEAHIFWHMALANGVILPDCGVYYAEQIRSAVEPGLEKVIESSPENYALCVVTLEHAGG